MQEEWTRWEPIEGLGKSYEIDSVSNDNKNGFVVLLSEYNDEKKRLRVAFENSVCSYRSTDETLRCKKIEQLNDKYGTYFYSKWAFFKVTNSEYLQWLSEQSCTISDDYSLGS